VQINHGEPNERQLKDLHYFLFTEGKSGRPRWQIVNGPWKPELSQSERIIQIPVR
jgi:hypothetical protein